ncbi:hypothetical protein [Bacillus smithii]|uniref:DUF5659 domain-containing protein n=1 Tax=Bacillus smithii 7_3_47FAA TaxID=665952 RepID=G9QIQ2_9BACI|nr:hypothetical protein [Bacillus smithii]EHL78970.1 hypothetical protein HMPREF1015_02979 [Bacillus smithii 7_3_47FAA]
MKGYFFVYDRNLKNHLSESGFRFITHARSIKDNREFWLFTISNELQESIKEFNERKNMPKKA